MKKLKPPKVKELKVSIKPVKLKKMKMPKKAKEHYKEEKVMDEFKHGELHSGSKKGPKVKSRKQAVAIALSEASKAGEQVKPMKKKRK